MDVRPAATRVPDPDAVDFIRFCYRRRRVGWPELYDEMCAVANRGLFHGLCSDDLADRGIGFGLFEMPALAALARQVIAEEQALRRPVAVIIRAEEPPLDVMADADVAVEADVTAHAFATEEAQPAPTIEVRILAQPTPFVPLDDRTDRTDRPNRSESPIRFVALPAGA